MTGTILPGTVDAVMQGDNKFHAFVYGQPQNGFSYPIRREISEEQYNDYICDLEADYRDGDYVTFNIGAQQSALEDEAHRAWGAELDSQDLERQGLY